MTSARGTTVLAAFTIVLLAGCGRPADDAPPAAAESPSAAATADTPIQPCSFITKEEAENALDMSLQDPRAGDYNPVSRDAACEFDSAGELQVVALSVRITNLVNQEASVQRLRDLIGDGSEEITGLGDHAFYTLGQLFVFKGQRQVTVMVTPVVRPPEKRTAARDAVARLVLERL